MKIEDNFDTKKFFEQTTNLINDSVALPTKQCFPQNLLLPEFGRNNCI